MKQHFMMFAAYNQWANSRIYDAAADLGQHRVLGEAGDGPGHDYDGLGEDDRHHAGGDQPDGDEGLLSFPDPAPAHHLARDLDGDPPSGDRHRDDSGDGEHQDRQEGDREEDGRDREEQDER